MTSRAKRLTLVISAAALTAGIVAGVLAPEPAAAAKKLKDSDAFVITATVKRYTWHNTGDFSASGAIVDSGAAYGQPLGEYLLLRGELGDIYIDVLAPHWEQFSIVWGTGAYEGLTGSGAYTVSINYKKGDRKMHDGNYLPPSELVSTWKYRLEGTLGQ
jgi:hypothetical protein